MTTHSHFPRFRARETRASAEAVDRALSAALPDSRPGRIFMFMRRYRDNPLRFPRFRARETRTSAEAVDRARQRNPAETGSEFQSGL